MKIRNISCFLSLLIIIAFSVFLTGCVSTQPNVSIVDEKYPQGKTNKSDQTFLKAKMLLSDLSEKNTILAMELGKLPEFQDGVTSEELVGLENILGLYNATPTSFDKAFQEMYSIGIPEIRKYCSPLQALFWLSEDGTIQKEKKLLVDYSLQKLLDKAWQEKGWEGKGWNLFNTVADRLSSPELLDYYINRNFTKIRAPESKSHCASDVFAHKEGWCGELAAFGTKILKAAGYDAALYWDMGWPKQSYATTRAVSGHTVAAYKRDGLICIFVDFTPFGNELHECMDIKTFKHQYMLRTEPLPGW